MSGLMQDIPYQNYVVVCFLIYLQLHWSNVTREVTRNVVNLLT